MAKEIHTNWTKVVVGTASAKTKWQWISINCHPNACLIERQVGDLPKPNLLFLAELRQLATNISTRIEGFGMVGEMSFCMVFQKQIVQQADGIKPWWTVNSCWTYLRQISARSFEEVDVLLHHRLDWVLLPCPTTCPPNPLLIDWKVNRNEICLIYDSTWFW